MEWLQNSFEKRLRNKQILQSILTVGIIAVTINLGHFSRNIHTFGNPVGKGGEHTINELISLEGLLSNIVRGIQTHMPRSKNKYPEILNFAINGTTGILWRVHQFTGLDVRDVRTTLNQKYYFFDSPRPRGRDISHVLLIIISFLILTYRLIRKTDRDISTYFIITFITYILFSLLLKTHPSTARFQLTLFFLWSPLISLTLFRLANTPWNIVKFGIILIVWVLSLPTLVKNHINPLFPYNDSLVAGQPSRSLATYFLKKKTAYSNFEAMTTMISNNSCNKIAIDTYKLEDFYDYPFRIMLFEKGYEGTIEFIRVENETKIYENLDFSPCIVISKVDDYENFTNIPPVKFDEFNVMLIEGP